MTSKPAAILAGVTLAATLAACTPADARAKPGHERRPVPPSPVSIFSPAKEAAKPDVPPGLLRLLGTSAARAVGRR